MLLDGYSSCIPHSTRSALKYRLKDIPEGTTYVQEQWTKWLCINLIFFKKVFFQSSFRFPEKLRVRYSYFPKSFVPTQLCHYQLPLPDGTFVTKDELTLTHHNHPKSIVYIRVFSWCCKFYGFGHIYKDMQTPLYYHTEYFFLP